MSKQSVSFDGVVLVWHCADDVVCRMQDKLLVCVPDRNVWLGVSLRVVQVNAFDPNALSSAQSAPIAALVAM